MNKVNECDFTNIDFDIKYKVLYRDSPHEFPSTFMTIEYAILKDFELVVIFSTGTVSDQTVVDYIALLAAEKDFSPDFNQLSDARFIKKNLVTQEGLEHAGKITPFSDKSRNAILVERALEKGRGNQYGAYSTESNDSYLVTSELDGALEWLGHSDQDSAIIVNMIADYHDGAK